MPELPFSHGDRQARIVKPLCAHPALTASAGSRPYPLRGLSGEEFRRGWANVQSNNYWSGTSNAGNTDNAWIVNMWDGNVNVNNKSNNNYVWPVRAGEWNATPIFSFENLYRNYLKCRKNKRNTINALAFEVNAEENLFRLSKELQNRTYRPSRSVCFVLEKPKMREIVAADFRDRVVHHLLVERLETIYEPVFIHDSYACRRGKGLHKAVGRVREFMRKAGGGNRPYFLHLDVRNFFMTIDRAIFFRLLEKKVRDEALLWLAGVILFHNPVKNCAAKGNRRLMDGLPPHKSLFHAPEGKGLPVGNLTSQFFANVYLNALDQYAKHALKCKYYVRYCDDFLILDASRGKLEEAKDRIEAFLDRKLSLALNSKFGAVLPVTNGIDFLGYIIRPDYVLARRRVVNNFKARLHRFEPMLVTEKGGMRIIRYDYGVLEKLRAVLASYLGHLKWADTYNLRHAVFEQYDFLKEYFSFDGGRVRPLYRYCQVFPAVRSQYLYYRSRFRESVLFFQTGRFFEFYDESVRRVKALSRLKRLKENRRGALYGFPLGLWWSYAVQTAKEGKSVIVIRETDRYIGRVKERLPVMKITRGNEKEVT
jgi:RNA-directed DNA polymerase